MKRPTYKLDDEVLSHSEIKVIEWSINMTLPLLSNKRRFNTLKKAHNKIKRVYHLKGGR